MEEQEIKKIIMIGRDKSLIRLLLHRGLTNNNLLSATQKQRVKVYVKVKKYIHIHLFHICCPRISWT